MPDIPTRFSVSLTDGRIEIEGPETFVAQQVERFHSLIERALTRLPSRREAQKISTESKEEPAEPAGTPELAEYSTVFASADGKIQITKDLPGKRKAQKMLNAALLLTLGNSLSGNQTTAFEEIRATCNSHGCLDSPNFAKTLTAERELFVFSGSRRKRTARLTQPGRKRAVELADELNK